MASSASDATVGMIITPRTSPAARTENVWTSMPSHPLRTIGPTNATAKRP